MSGKATRGPRCGDDFGCYTRARVTQALFYKFGSDEPYESEFDGSAQGGKVAYCQSCGRRLGNVADLIGGDERNVRREE